MDDDKQDDQLETLYERFRDDLTANRDSLYRDEQELVDIFDYAGDVRDDFVRLEVIILGSRLFPDSADLLKRRAILLADLSNDSFSQFMKANKVAETDVMWAIFQCRAYAPKGDEAVKALEGILDSYRLVEDEETIQFVNLVRELQQEDWMIENVDLIRRRCDYAPTLLYEIARVAETQSQLKLSIKLLEELTEIDPFNCDYWGLLAELQSATEQFDDSLTSLDYAKALTPDDFELYSLEGYVRLKKGDNDGSIKALQRAIELSPDCYPAMRNLAEAYKQSGMAELAKPIVAKLFEQDPSDAVLLNDMVVQFPEKMAENLSRFYKASGETDEALTMQRIGEICAGGHPAESLAYLRWYRDHFEISQTASFAFLELLYVNGHYEEAYTYIMEHCTKLILEINEIPIVAIIASTLIKLRHFADAREFCKIWIDKLIEPSWGPNAFRLVNRGLLETLKDMVALIENNDNPTDAEIAKVVV